MAIYNIPIKPIPNQKISVSIQTISYTIVLTTRDNYLALKGSPIDLINISTSNYNKSVDMNNIGQLLYFDLLRGNDYIIAGAKVGMTPIIVYPYIINKLGFNFKMVTIGQDEDGNIPSNIILSNNGQIIYYPNFNNTQFLLAYDVTR